MKIIKEIIPYIVILIVVILVRMYLITLSISCIL